MTPSWRRYLLIVVMLAMAPVFREMSTAFISNHHIPFSSAWDIVHTVSESAVMFILGVVFVIADRRFTKRKMLEIQLTQTVSIGAVAALAEYRDLETGEHLQRIKYFVEFLADRLKHSTPYSSYLQTNTRSIEDIGNAALLHDIGKIAIPDEVLNKPGQLTDAEFMAMKQHTVLGGEMLANADKQFRDQLGRESYLALAQSIALHHHEKWDGSGYPNGLRGEEIPLAARITALCDVYDAVTSERAYKKAWTHQEAVELIRKGRGKHFDPVIADIFLKNHERFKGIKNLPPGGKFYSSNAALFPR